jgi:methylglutaconyl-CoA hydratase
MVTFRIAPRLAVLVPRRSLATSSTKNVQVSVDSDGFASVTLNRADVHNAFSDHVINELDTIFTSLRNDTSLRGIFLKSTGKSFCAGADLEWMKRASKYTREENMNDAMRLSGMLNNVNTQPHPTIALVQGAAYGGGVGLVSVCDIAVGTKKAIFSLSEVKLGLIPATISPYVINAIGQRASRRYFLTAERFDAQRAYDIGLLHEVVEDEEGLRAKENELKAALLIAGPASVRASKNLINLNVAESIRHGTALRLAEQRETSECKEGLTAFFEKRNASWNKKK